MGNNWYRFRKLPASWQWDRPIQMDCHICYKGLDGLKQLAVHPSGLWIELFLQLYVTRVPLGKLTFSTVYALLEKKTQKIYEDLFNGALTKCRELDLFPDPVNVVVDFEFPVIQVIRSILKAQVQGCVYDLCQSTYNSWDLWCITGKMKISVPFVAVRMAFLAWIVFKMECSI